MSNRAVGTKIKISSSYIAGLTSISGIAKTADTLDTTTLDSDGGYRTFTGGFKDGGDVAVSGFFEPGDAGQKAMDDAFESGEVIPFQIIFPPNMGADWMFSGVVTAFSTGAELDSLVSFEATIKVSGKPNLGTVPSAGLTALSLTGTGGTLSPTFYSDVQSYAFVGVSAASATVTATAANHTMKLHVDGEFQQDLISGTASLPIPLELGGSRKLTIAAWEDGKTTRIYEVIVIKST